MLDHHVHRPNLVANTVKTATINTTTKMSKKWETGMLSRLNEDNKDFFINCFDPIAHEIKVLSMKDKARLQALLDNPIHWGNYESKKFVDEYKVARGIDSISGIKKERNDQRLAVFQRNDLDLSSDWNSGTYQ
jgi:hypothetical protein